MEHTTKQAVGLFITGALIAALLGGCCGGPGVNVRDASTRHRQPSAEQLERRESTARGLARGVGAVTSHYGFPVEPVQVCVCTTDLDCQVRCGGSY